ncbi:MAG: peptidylprolyl isomerase [Xanthomonadaceae bacterium]|nr:peptidylprolyl isomerase [Xanthomonadaceae bacterium]
MIKIAKPLISAIAMLALLLPVVAGGQDVEKIDEIVAIVDEGVILRSELESSINGIVQQIQARGERQPPRQVLEEQVLERLIMSEVQIQRAEQTGIRVTDQEVDRSLEDVARQNNLTLSQLRQAVESDGVEFNEFRGDIRKQLLTSQLRQRIVDSMDDVTDTEVDILLESDFFESDEYHLSQIALQFSPAAGPVETREVEAKMSAIAEEIKSGMDFATAAINYSEAPDALEGGAIGWRNLNTMPRQLADRIRDLRPGQVSDPIFGNGSLMLVKVNDRRMRGEVIVNELNARHIMIQPSELMSPEAARELAEDLYRRISDGEDFGALAREFSDDNRSANIGGEMAWFPEGAYGDTFQAVCDSLAPGEVSQPFQTQQGWHIVQLEGQRQSDRTDEALRAEARNMLMDQRTQAEIDRTLRQIRDEAYVQIKL